MPDLREPPYVSSPAAPPRSPCRRYSAGHAPHYIQARLSLQSPHEDWRRVVVMGVLGDVVWLADDGEFLAYRNHETDYLLWVVSQVGGAEAELNTDYQALFMRPWPDGGRAVFSVQPAERMPEPCSIDE